MPMKVTSFVESGEEEINENLVRVEFCSGTGKDDVMPASSGNGRWMAEQEADRRGGNKKSGIKERGRSRTRRGRIPHEPRTKMNVGRVVRGVEEDRERNDMEVLRAGGQEADLRPDVEVVEDDNMDAESNVSLIHI